MRIMSWNIQSGGGLLDEPARWSGIVKVVREVNPDVLCIQEAGGWTSDGHAPLAAAEHDLGLRALIAPAPSTLHTVVMWRGLRWESWDIRYASRLHHGMGVAVLTGGGLPMPLAVISAHLIPYSTATAAEEAQILAARVYRHGGAGIIAGDINHLPWEDDEPDWEAVQPYNRSARTLPSESPWRGNRIVGQVLRQADLTDVAGYLAQTRGDQSLRAPTGGGIRVDQVHVTPALLPAVVDYQRLDPQGHSDHWPILVTFDPERLDQSAAVPWT